LKRASLGRAFYLWERINVDELIDSNGGVFMDHFIFPKFVGLHTREGSAEQLPNWLKGALFIDG